ncbi:hypothetical protein PG985_012419 [Apiospora marii]|uniref:Uncharacterized protein n=1 Tax=Apiospora marii TaxID=335849 RepID=A0ABR1RDC3_9PEZI
MFRQARIHRPKEIGIDVVLLCASVFTMAVSILRVRYSIKSVSKSAYVTTLGVWSSLCCGRQTELADYKHKLARFRHPRHRDM